MVRLVLSRVAATVVNGAHDLDVKVSLSSLTVHDAHMSEKLGRPCRLLTSGAATAVGVDGSSFGSSPEAIGSSPEAIGSSLVVRYRSVAEQSPEYRGVDSEVHAALGPVSLAVRRPSIAALAALPSLMNPKNEPDDSDDDADEVAGEVGGGDFGGGEAIAVESGKRRVAMRIDARVDALRLALLLDDALEDDAGGV